MTLTSKAGAELLERARALFADLDKLKASEPADANVIAAMSLSHLKNSFGTVPEMLVRSE